ncbi:hypothetical protein ABPG72_020014 [Tetrahymena utriculariae]
MKTTDFVKGLVVAYMDTGLSCRTAEQMINNLIVKYQTEEMMVDDRIIEEISISYKACSQIFKRFKEELSYQDKRELNGKQNTYNEEEQKAIAQMVEENVGESLKSLTNNPQINPKNAEIHVMRNVFKNQDIKCYKQPNKIALNNQHKENRMKFANKVKRWSKNWTRVIFSDECQLSIDPHNQYYYAKSKDDIPEDLFKKKQNYPLRVHVWGVISSNSPLELVQIEGTLNSNGYVQILDSFFKNIQQNLPEHFIFQQDNAGIHRAQIVQDYMEENEIEVLDWPALSPDLSPIENIWSIIKSELWSFKNVIKNQDDLFQASKQIFFNSEQITKTIANSYQSIQMRIQQVINVQGDQI